MEKAPDYYTLLLEERIKTLEEKVFKKNKKSETTRAQQMLLLKHLGFLDHISNLELTKKNKAVLLSALLNASSENIEDDLTHIQSNKSPIITKGNYSVLYSLFDQIGLKDLKKKTQEVLDDLHKKG